jgi:hypothetical protein
MGRIDRILPPVVILKLERQYCPDVARARRRLLLTRLSVGSACSIIGLPRHQIIMDEKPSTMKLSRLFHERLCGLQLSAVLLFHVNIDTRNDTYALATVQGFEPQLVHVEGNLVSECTNGWRSHHVRLTVFAYLAYLAQL